MKKWLSLLLCVTLIFPFAACSGGTSSLSGNGPSEPHVNSSLLSSQTSADPSGASEDTEESPGILIAYFSWSGNTEQMAQMIQAETGGDLFEIAPAAPYTDDYDELLDIAQQEQADDSRPALASQVENWDIYDVVFVGYPKMEQGYICV